jgi:uncharacterized HAD superfamily protein
MPEIPHIVIDIDEVLADTMASLNAFHNRVYGTNYTSEDYASYRFWELWGCTEEECFTRITAFLDSPEWQNIQPFPGAQAAIQSLQGYAKLTALTSRRAHLQERTQAWLDQHFGPGAFDQLLFSKNSYHPLNAHLQTKGKIAIELNADVVIEDSLEYALEIAAQNIPVILIDHPWNQRADLPMNITRVRDWSEIVAILRTRFPNLMF